MARWARGGWAGGRAADGRGGRRATRPPPYPFPSHPSGSCWAHASLSTVADRIKIRKGGLGPDTMLGRQTLLNCAAYKGMGDGCDGGDVIDVFHYMAK